jgi:hypothetical protein
MRSRPPTKGPKIPPPPPEIKGLNDETKAIGVHSEAKQATEGIPGQLSSRVTEHREDPPRQNSNQSGGGTC